MALRLRECCVLGPSFRFGAVVQLWCGEILVACRAERAKGSPKTHTPPPPLGYPVSFAHGVTRGRAVAPRPPLWGAAVSAARLWRIVVRPVGLVRLVGWHRALDFAVGSRVPRDRRWDDIRHSTTDSRCPTFRPMTSHRMLVQLWCGEISCIWCLPGKWVFIVELWNYGNTQCGIIHCFWDAFHNFALADGCFHNSIIPQSARH